LQSNLASIYQSERLQVIPIVGAEVGAAMNGDFIMMSPEQLAEYSKNGG